MSPHEIKSGLYIMEPAWSFEKKVQNQEGEMNIVNALVSLWLPLVYYMNSVSLSPWMDRYLILIRVGPALNINSAFITCTHEQVLSCILPC